MTRFVYTSAMLEFLREGFKEFRVPELTIKFNDEFSLDKTQQQIRACLKNNKFKSGRKPGFLKGETIKLLSPDQVDFVRQNYPHLTREELTAELNKEFDLTITVKQLVSFVKNHKILSGRTGYFEKGSDPWNKGTKGLMKPNETSFQKGHTPANRKPVGSERIDSKDGYILTKTDQVNPYTGYDGFYRAKHVVLWEQHNGPVPNGNVVRFVDGDKTNINIHNLMLVDLGVNAQLNALKYGEHPKETKPTILAIAKLQQAAHDRLSKSE